MTDIEYLQLAIENSRKSMEEGNFPAGAIVVIDDKIIASEVSSPYPGLLHADSKAVVKAFTTHGVLSGATLYIGLESCLMCTGVTYWSGIRKVVYAVPKSRLNQNYYETAENTQNIISTFHEPIEFVKIGELEQLALSIVKDWERNNT